jgi:hypothetical protein
MQQMLQAQLKGKLSRPEEDMEDLLTSNVFGSIKYLPAKEGLLPILVNSQDVNGNPPKIDLEQISKVTYDFWPWIKEQLCCGCEPDVRISLQLANGSKVNVFVEAKYLSSKSSFADEEREAPSDQLAREWDNLQEISSRDGATPLFLYVTADLGYPVSDFSDSVKDYEKYKSKEMTMYWISWRKLPGLFKKAKKDTILYDLVGILRRMGLTFYEGIMKVEPIQVKWTFKIARNWDWTLFEDIEIHWNFKLNKYFIWNYHLETIVWRFRK